MLLVYPHNFVSILSISITCSMIMSSVGTVSSIIMICEIIIIGLLFDAVDIDGCIMRNAFASIIVVVAVD